MKKSSCIRSISYSKYYKGVRVVFHSNPHMEYVYPCTPQQYATFHRVNSPGKYYNRVIGQNAPIESTGTYIARPAFWNATRPVRMVCTNELTATFSEEFSKITGLL